jgi:hypothetical protein
MKQGRAVPQAANGRLPTARTKSGYAGFVVHEVESVARFLRVLQFLLPILIPPNSSYSSIIRGCYKRLIIGRRTKRTQHHPKPLKFETKLWRQASLLPTVYRIRLPTY